MKVKSVKLLAILLLVGMSAGLAGTAASGVGTGSDAGLQNYGSFLDDEVSVATDAGLWTLVTANAAWQARSMHTSVALPDGSLVLMAGEIRYDPETTYPRDDTWRSTDAGATWTQVNAGGGWYPRYGASSVVLPDGSIILMGGVAFYYYNDTWRSTDAGTTWTRINASSGWRQRFAQSSVVLPNGTVILTGGMALGSGFVNDVWCSNDGGVTWTQVNASAGWKPRYQHATVALSDGSVLLIGGGTGMNYYNDVWRSADAGATWTEINASAGWSGREGHTSVVAHDGSIILMGGGNAISSLRNDVWRSTDNGTTWTEITASAGWIPRWRQTSSVLPDGSIVLMGGSDTTDARLNDVWRTEPYVTVTTPDGGQKWRRGTAHAIKWNITDGSSPTVNITLWKGAVMKKTIRNLTPTAPGGLGTFKWKIPAKFPTGKDYWVMVRTSTGFMDRSDAYFTIRK